MDRFSAAGLAGLWMQADWVIRATALLLLTMSIITWSVVLIKAIQAWRWGRQARRLPALFWTASTLEQAFARTQATAADGPFAAIAAGALEVGRRRDAGSAPALDASVRGSDYAGRVLRGALQRVLRRLDSGLSALASIGATAPFIGLFGTVWGIYRALTDIGLSGQVSIDRVAGPVGEALIMTAVGIAVAVPAVLGYNMLLRANRAIAQELDGFTHDLHAYLLRSGQADSDEGARK